MLYTKEILYPVDSGDEIMEIRGKGCTVVWSEGDDLRYMPNAQLGVLITSKTQDFNMFAVDGDEAKNWEKVEHQGYNKDRGESYTCVCYVQPLREYPT